MKIDILGVKFNSLMMGEANTLVETFVNSNSPHQIVTANPEIVLQSLKNKNYQSIINQANFVTADGIGIIWAAKFLSLKSHHCFFTLIQFFITGLSLLLSPNYCKNIIPERIAGVDLMEKICQIASQKGWKIYLLGGQKGIAEKTAEVLKKRYLNLNIVGAKTGHDEIMGASASDNKKIINDINQQEPVILFVAFGAPKQDFWIYQNLTKLTSVKVAMGVGGAFDFIANQVKRAPKIYQDLNLEWLYRLIKQPWRFFRIFNATIKFAYYVLKYKSPSNPA